MQYVFFSKMIQEQNLDQMVESLRYIGVEGVDLCVRPGYPVNPENVREMLPQARKKLEAAGLALGMVTTPGDCLDASTPETQAIFAACGESGVQPIKLGYWSYRGDYWDEVSEIRRALEGFSRLAEKHGVKACYHTHSGNCHGMNASMMMHLIQGFDPQYIGAYLDAGHLLVCGEPIKVALDIVGQHFTMMAFKDVKWFKESGKPAGREFLAVGEGLVDWEGWMAALVEKGFRGPVTFHSEFHAESPQDLLDRTKQDVAFIRGLEDKLRG